jgi:hypothetical protein
MATPTDLEYVEIQLALEGIAVDENRRLVRIPATAAEEIPRLYLCRHGGGWSRYYRHDLPTSIVDALDQLTDEECFDRQAAVRSILEGDARCPDVWTGTSYVFPTVPRLEASPDVVRLEEADRSLAITFDRELTSLHRPIYAVLVDGRVGSTCVSARENDQAAEAWVQTSPEHRRRGFARQVTAAWARDVLLGGKIAFYSHRRENLASGGVALSLALRPFVDGVGYL